MAALGQQLREPSPEIPWFGTDPSDQFGAPLLDALAALFENHEDLVTSAAEPGPPAGAAAVARLDAIEDSGCMRRSGVDRPLVFGLRARAEAGPGSAGRHLRRARIASRRAAFAGDNPRA